MFFLNKNPGTETFDRLQRRSALPIDWRGSVMPEIVVERLGEQRVDRKRAYRVFIDDAKVGKIKSGETKVFQVSPGRHDLQLKIDWCSSRKLQVDVKDGESKMVCKPKANQQNPFKLTVEGLYLVTLGCRGYIELKPQE